MKVKLFVAVAALFAALPMIAGTLTFEYSSNRASAIYKAGEKIVLTARLLEDGKPANGKFIRYKLYHDHKVVKRGDVPASGELTVETSGKKPGWIFIQTWAVGADKKFIKQNVTRRGKTSMGLVSGGIGAMVEPEKITTPLAEPADFDEFWNKVKSELAAVPMKELEKVQLKRYTKVKVYDIKISCAGEKPVSGYLCMPVDAKAKSCPAIVSFHGAGVRSSSKPTGWAAKGLIALDINAHGIVNGKPSKFYEDLRKNYYHTTLDANRKTRYAHWNKHDRDLYYFKGMYMRLMRALEYVKSLPEWDGKHLIVTGGSQGGAQVIAACGLDKDITFALAGVPSMCDHSGCLAGRRSGGPTLYKSVNGKPDDPAVARCALYYESVFFARRIKCPIYLSAGFIDTTCPPSGIFAAYNSIPGKKAIQTTPTAGHVAPMNKGNKALEAYVKNIYGIKR